MNLTWAVHTSYQWKTHHVVCTGACAETKNVTGDECIRSVLSLPLGFSKPCNSLLKARRHNRLQPVPRNVDVERLRSQGAPTVPFTRPSCTTFRGYFNTTHDSAADADSIYLNTTVDCLVNMSDGRAFEWCAKVGPPFRDMSTALHRLPCSTRHLVHLLHRNNPPAQSEYAPLPMHVSHRHPDPTAQTYSIPSRKCPPPPAQPSELPAHRTGWIVVVIIVSAAAVDNSTCCDQSQTASVDDSGRFR